MLLCRYVEFEDFECNRFMSMHFLKGTELCKVLFCRSGLPTSDLTGDLGSLFRLLTVVSTKADIVAVSGCPADLVRTIDKAAGFTKGFQCCFRSDQMSLARLLHKPSYSIFGRIDLSSVLRGLMVSLGRSHTEDWAWSLLSCPRLVVLVSRLE